jgi:two-component system phosphate regulon sensor histidine kinase PhoR
MNTVRRLAWLVTGGTLAVGAMTVAALMWWQTANERAARDRRLVEIATTLATRASDLLAGPTDELWAAVRRWGEASGLRVTVIRADGVVIADTTTLPDLVQQMENHGRRPEVVAARAQGSGVSHRRSATTSRVTTYVAVRLDRSGEPAGFLRLAWEGRPLAIPWGGALVALLTAVAAGVAARAGTRRWQQAAARHLAAWSDLPGDESIETLAEEADRRFRAERERLEREAEVVRAALERVGEGVVLLDREGSIRFANAAATTLLGEGLVLGRPWIEAMRTPEMTAAVREVLVEGGERHTTVPGVDGMELAVKVAAVDHPVLAAAVVLRDVRAEHQLERSRRALVADLAHELRTPLTVLTGLAEELADGGGDRELTETLVRQVAKLRAFAAELEELARVESGQLGLHLEEVGAAAVTRQVLADLANSAERAGVSLRHDGDEVRLRTDLVRLTQVLTNLVDNGIRYNRRGGHVTVHTRPAAGGVRIEVADDGIGIPAAEIGLVFQRFYRVRRQPESTRGSGLGLAIVKHVTRALGGTVNLDSREGRGTTVTLVLPSQDATTV